MKPAIWSPLALEQLWSIVEYIWRDDQAAAWNVYDRVVERVERLSHFPEFGPPGRLRGTRQLVMTGTPYVWRAIEVGVLPALGIASLAACAPSAKCWQRRARSKIAAARRPSEYSSRSCVPWLVAIDDDVRHRQYVPAAGVDGFDDRHREPCR